MSYLVHHNRSNIQPNGYNNQLQHDFPGQSAMFSGTEIGQNGIAAPWPVGDQLHRASYEGDLLAVRRLSTDQHVRVDSTDGNGQTPLMGPGKSMLYVLLLESGAEVDKVQMTGETALAIAAYRGHLRVAKKLVEIAGACVDAVNDDANAPLCEAARAGYVEVVAWLAQVGAYINARDKRGQTSLMHLYFLGQGQLTSCEASCDGV
ncbi:unnamed protein product [Phytophthora lilii]|uniref:Unnamed protein product n=1 Tax=Phytophthora lilii TaxID=2077276 RepID=A0A9W6U383_9STRA|nr:unnamed protein product [Phytophthora lilii]